LSTKRVPSCRGIRMRPERNVFQRAFIKHNTPLRGIVFDNQAAPWHNKIMALVENILVRPILGFRGKETIEVRLSDSASRTAACRIPFGVSEGKYEAVYCSPQEAVQRGQEMVLPAIKGFAFGNQPGFDKKLIDLDGTPQKSRLGGNLMLGASLAYARLSSLEQQRPLYLYLAELAGLGSDYRPPRLLCNLVEGGVHADNDLEFQEHLIIPRPGQVRQSLAVIKQYAVSFFAELKKMNKAMVFGDEGGWAGAFDTEESLMRLIQDVQAKTGVELDFGFDIAANNVTAFEPKAYLRRYLGFINDYPIIFIEDPFPEEGYERFYQELLMQAGKKVQVVGDDLVATNPEKIKYFSEKKAINSVIIKPDQVGTLTETLESVKLARKNKWTVAVAHRAQETVDDYLADLAVGIRADFVKFGYLYQAERLAKYNRLLEIEDGLDCLV